MINVIWLWLLLIGIGVATYKCFGLAIVSGALTMNLSWDPLRDMTKAIWDSAEFAVTLAIGLVGIMALWLGIMKIAEESGLIGTLGKALKPIMTWLFPGIPPDHPAMGSLIMAIAAGMLGLGNAATPLGLKAMNEMQKLNKLKDTATNEMATYMAMATSSVTIIPATIIGIRAAADSNNPSEIIGPVILATVISTTVGITASKLLQRLPRYRLPDDPSPSIEDKKEETNV
ncbi:MAG TPA: nucleoside recognition protein [Candidatus Marinimicrobia bacterium]|nr:nucleoside recognition protein [Candidatus Neomarinimicrobiota bacterium]